MDVHANLLPPDHLIHDPRVGLDDSHDLRGDVLVYVVRDGDAVVACSIQGDGRVDGLQKRHLVDAGDDEAALVQRLRALGRSADAHRRERMPHRCEEPHLLGQTAGR